MTKWDSFERPIFLTPPWPAQAPPTPKSWNLYQKTLTVWNILGWVGLRGGGGSFTESEGAEGPGSATGRRRSRARSLTGDLFSSDLLTILRTGAPPRYKSFRLGKCWKCPFRNTFWQHFLKYIIHENWQNSMSPKWAFIEPSMSLYSK